MPKLHVIITSTRPQRVGLTVGKWFFERAKLHGKFEVELVDLKEMNLPLFDEPLHPRLRQYQHAHTRAWSQSVEAADAFVFVVPEYNFSMPPSLVNALDYLYLEWNYKPAAFVSYGGASGGMRSVQTSKLMLTSLKVMPIPEAVAIPFVTKHLDPDGNFKAEAIHEQAAGTALDELLRWTNALKPMRTPA